MLGSGKGPLARRGRYPSMALDIGENPGLGAPGAVEIRVQLEVHPESFGRAEVLGQAEGGTRGNSTSPIDDLVDALVRHMEGVGQLTLADSHGLEEFLKKDLSWVYRWAVGRKACHRLVLSWASALMVVHDLHLLGALTCPTETDSVPFIDADAELVPPVSPKALKAIARRSPQVIE